MIRTGRDGELECSCDECGVTAYGGTLDFREFVATLKEEGWRIRKEDDEWCHYCCDCK